MNAQQSPAAQKKTVQALQALEQGQLTIARDIVAATRDPLASKLYTWMLFKRKLDTGNFSRLAQFVRSNPEWPGVSDMKKQVEQIMPFNVPPQDIIAWFDDYPPQTARGIDLYMKALIGSGQGAKAKTYLSDWWASTLMSREEQREIFRLYKAYLDLDAHKRRFDRLLFAEQYTNARAIAQVLGKGYPELAEARIALAEEKGNVNAYIAKIPPALQSDPGLLYERLRWRRRNNLDMEAIQLIHDAPPAHKIQNPEEWWHEQHILIRRLIEKKLYESAYLLASKHFQTEGLSFAEAEWMAGWLALRFMKNPTRAYEHFEALYQKVETPISKARGAYWAGRAAKDFGKKDLAQEWFEKAARFQTVFYGQTAGAELGMASALPHAAPPKITDEDRKALEAREMVQAARLFDKAGMRNEASQFLRAFVKSEKTPKAYLFSAQLAADLKRYHDAVKIAKDATNEGMFLTAQSYPVITERLQNVPVEWALVHALIRQESLFDFKAESSAGALGLMQLMPATAKEVAKKLGVAHSKDKLTNNPDHNIRLGSKYLQDMLERFGGSYPLAIAAYNAGPGRVNQWIKTYGDPRTGEVALLDWIEMIPIYETRNYVQRVMESVYVYRLRLKGIQKTPVSDIHIAMIGDD